MSESQKMSWNTLQILHVSDLLQRPLDYENTALYRLRFIPGEQNIIDMTGRSGGVRSEFVLHDVHNPFKTIKYTIFGNDDAAKFRAQCPIGSTCQMTRFKISCFAGKYGLTRDKNTQLGTFVPSPKVAEEVEKMCKCVRGMSTSLNDLLVCIPNEILTNFTALSEKYPPPSSSSSASECVLERPLAVILVHWTRLETQMSKNGRPYTFSDLEVCDEDGTMMRFRAFGRLAETIVGSASVQSQLSSSSSDGPLTASSASPLRAGALLVFFGFKWTYYRNTPKLDGGFDAKGDFIPERVVEKVPVLSKMQAYVKECTASGRSLVSRSLSSDGDGKRGSAFSKPPIVTTVPSFAQVLTVQELLQMPAPNPQNREGVYVWVAGEIEMWGKHTLLMGEEETDLLCLSTEDNYSYLCCEKRHSVVPLNAKRERFLCHNCSGADYAPEQLFRQARVRFLLSEGNSSVHVNAIGKEAEMLMGGTDGAQLQQAMKQLPCDTIEERLEERWSRPYCFCLKVSSRTSEGNMYIGYDLANMVPLEQVL